MTDSPKITAIDPHTIPETLCEGPFNISWAGRLGTLTFMHTRPKLSALMEEPSRIEPENVVVARIVMSVENLLALRDLLTQHIKVIPGEAPVPVATRH